MTGQMALPCGNEETMTGWFVFPCFECLTLFVGYNSYDSLILHVFEILKL